MAKTLWRLTVGVLAVLVTCSAWFALPQTGTTAPAPIRIKAGFLLTLELDTPLNSATARVDDEVWFTTRNDVRAEGQLAIPRGTPIRGAVVAVQPAMVNGKNRDSQIEIRLEELPLAEGGSQAVVAHTLKIDGEKGPSGGGVSGTVSQGTQGAVLGGMITRSAKGAGIGAIAGVGVAILTEKLKSKGPTSEVDLPMGSIFEVKLERPLDISNPALLAKSVPKPPAPPTVDIASTPVDVATSRVDAATSRVDAATSRVDAASRPAVDVATVSPTETPRVAGVPEFDPLPASPPESRNTATDSVATPTKSASGTFSVDVNLVQVDAIVRDRTGKPMGSLSKEDFRVFEDGVEQQIRFFSRDQLPLAVALVIDRSGSVAPLMSQVQSAAYQALQLLKAGDEVCLFTFAANVEQLEELTTNRQRIGNRIGGIRAGGGTAIVDGVSEALRYLNAAAPDKRRAVILISDNVEGRSVATVDYAVQLALESEASIYSVKVGNGAGVSILGLPGIGGLPTPRLPGLGSNDPVHTITKETGGEIFDATGGSSIGAALTTAVDRLKLRYTMSYASTKGERSSKGGYHRIEVQLHSRFGKPDTNYTIHARSGYYDQAK